MQQLLSIAVALLAGLLMTRVLKMMKIRLPDATAFLIAGILIGPYCLGKLGVSGMGFANLAEVKAVESVSTVALGFIAFAIGNEFRLSQLRETGRQAGIIGVLQAVAATVLVDVALVALHFAAPDVISIPAAITLGAIAAATAPAATLMVVRQYKAKGKLTDLLLPIVALDDAVGLVIFAISFGAAQSLSAGNADILLILTNAVVEIAASLTLGALMGFILTKIETLFYSNSNRLSMAIAFVVLTIALSELRFEIGRVTVSFSSLLVCMMLGTAFCNLCDRSPDIMDRADKWTAPIFALFFVLSGAELDLAVLMNPSVVCIGMIFIVVRSLGKYFGSMGSAAIAGCDSNIRKYLGITLLPQAGVALGMSATASSLGADGILIRNIALFSVLIYELCGPSLTHWALIKAGDVNPVEPEKQSHARFKHKAAK